VAAELLRKLLQDESSAKTKRNVVEVRTFPEMLKATVRKYQNRAVETT